METIKRNKWLSRTFYIAAAWTILVGIGILVQGITNQVIPLTALVSSAGLICATYVGGEKLLDNTRVKKENGK